jgi:hypothetical protein
MARYAERAANNLRYAAVAAAPKQQKTTLRMPGELGSSPATVVRAIRVAGSRG